MLLTYRLLVLSITVTSSLKKTPPHLLPLILTICGSQKVIGSKQLAIFVLPFWSLNIEEVFLNTVFLKFPRDLELGIDF